MNGWIHGLARDVEDRFGPFMSRAPLPTTQTTIFGATVPVPADAPVSMGRWAWGAGCFPRVRPLVLRGREAIRRGQVIGQRIPTLSTFATPQTHGRRITRHTLIHIH